MSRQVCVCNRHMSRVYPTSHLVTAGRGFSISLPLNGVSSHEDIWMMLFGQLIFYKLNVCFLGLVYCVCKYNHKRKVTMAVVGNR